MDGRRPGALLPGAMVAGALVATVGSVPLAICGGVTGSVVVPR